MSEVTTLLFKAEAEGVEVVVFPELSLTGYSCQDLFAQQTLLVAAEEAMVQLLNDTQQLDVIGIVGSIVVSFSSMVVSLVSCLKLSFPIITSFTRNDGSLLLTILIQA